MAVAAGSTSGHFVSRETRLILIGRTGAGKSSTGNNIIGKPIFKVEFSASSITKSCEHFMFERFGRDILLVDSPGFFDTVLSKESLEEELKKSIVLTSPGVHAFLFVVGMARFTKEEVTSVKRFLTLFGSESTRHVIVIFTRKDELEMNGKSLEFFIDSHKELKSFIEETGRNYIAVNNKSTEDNEEFARELLGLVDKLTKRNRGHFTNKMYQEAEQQMKEIEDKLTTANKTSHDEYRQSTEQEARRLTRDRYDSTDNNWKVLAGIVAAVAVGVALSFGAGPAAMVATVAYLGRK